MDSDTLILTRRFTFLDKLHDFRIGVEISLFRKDFVLSHHLKWEVLGVSGTISGNLQKWLVAHNGVSEVFLSTK